MRLDGWLSPAPDPARVAWLGQWTYAHRGLHGGLGGLHGSPHGSGGIENSPAAFAAAIEAGLGIECDVRRSADGRAIVFHDRELDRLTQEHGPVASRTAAQLARIPLRSGEPIPTLRDLLDRVDGKVPLLIELKTMRERPVSPLCRAVWRELEGYRGDHAVMGFDPRVGHWFAGHAPSAVRGLVVSEENARTLGGAVRRYLALWRARPHFLAYDVRDLPSRFAAAQRKRGLPVLTWTVTGAASAQKGATHADASIVEGEGVAAAIRARPLSASSAHPS